LKALDLKHEDFEKIRRGKAVGLRRKRKPCSPIRKGVVTVGLSPKR
jgi:hypothetical protein